MPLHPEALTWAGLLSQWVQFAQATLAIPEDREGERWRASVPAIINLQAVTFALADLDRLAADEKALALDKAELLISAAVDELRTIWSGASFSDELQQIIDDAQQALRKVTD